ncbi:MAG: cyclic nucleotide-binding domain-containing protein [Lachnospiraceae bacterium]|nr:cyclic nucleotide-binding domain-containing protein [Lachnospiraceae bacterium]
MEIIKAKKDQIIARKNGKVKYWYLIQEGVVLQKFGFSEVKLEKNAIIGILEKDIFLCDYVAGEDTVLAGFICENSEDLKNLLTGQEKIRNIFLRASLEQRHQMLSLYSDLYNKTRQFHMFVETVYNDYKTFCGKYKIEEQSFLRMEHFNPLEMQHKAEAWEINNNNSIVKNYMQEYLQLMKKDDSLTVGAIMESAAQMRRFTLGIGEMEAYLSYNKDVLISESANDLLQLLFELSIKTYAKKYDIEPITKDMNLIIKVAEKLNVYNTRMLGRRLKEFKSYDYNGDMSQGANGNAGGENIRREIDIMKEDCVDHILEYAGFEDEEAETICKMIESYRDLPDRTSMDSEVYALRRKLTSVYYDIYYKVFMRAVKDEKTLTPVLEMFLNFGFMDVSFIGEEHAMALYDLTAHLDICHSEHIYTIYEWLKCIYKGEKVPSKNEFDMDYPAYLADLCKNGKLTSEQAAEYKEDGEKKVEFEIKNMFSSVNKMTYGKITTFCPILCKNDLINTVEKMLITSEKLENAMNEVRKIDYSAFYREVMFSDPDKGINCERIMKEILPDIILMPNAGTRVTMWQETTGVKSDTPGRFMFPVFTALDVDDLMLGVVGQFRWEMCRKIQGIRWNDVREKSLTAEYCTYIQFYRKNHDLSADAKEKIKSALIRAQNNYREVFVKDYVNWIKFESRGSFRLNKVSRDILVRYCPFAKGVRKELKSNPLYQNAISKFDVETAKKLQRFNSVYDKYVKAGGEKTKELKENLLFYQL